MSIRQAIQFFLKYGNINGDVESCLKEKPSIQQLHWACEKAKVRGASDDEIREAKLTILEFYIKEL